jgi:AcrR family transcriptional regulator
MTPDAPTRSRLPRAERERQMLETAYALFAERGYAAVTMDEVAAAVGVTKPLLYTYFGNKDRLYLTCMRPAGDALLETVVAAIGATTTPTDALRSGIHAFFRFIDADRNAWRVLFDETLPAGGEVARGVLEYRERLEGLVTAALLDQIPPGRGSRRARAEVAALSAALLGAAEALGRWWLRTGAIPAAEAADLLIATVEPGIRERAAGRRGASASASNSTETTP